MQKFIKSILAMFMNYSLIIGKTYRTKQEQNILFFTWLFNNSMLMQENFNYKK